MIKAPAWQGPKGPRRRPYFASGDARRGDGGQGSPEPRRGPQSAREGVSWGDRRPSRCHAAARRAPRASRERRTIAPGVARPARAAQWRRRGAGATAGRRGGQAAQGGAQGPWRDHFELAREWVRRGSGEGPGVPPGTVFVRPPRGWTGQNITVTIAFCVKPGRARFWRGGFRWLWRR